MSETFTSTPSGLKYLDSQAGTGATAQPGQKAKVHYTGWLTNGQKFDSSLDRKEPFEFTLGAPALGYGARGAGGLIPPNAELVFEVELLGLR